MTSSLRVTVRSGVELIYRVLALTRVEKGLRCEHPVYRSGCRRRASFANCFVNSAGPKGELPDFELDIQGG